MASTEPRRGELWLVSLGAVRKGEPGKSRPVVVVSVDDINAGIPDELIVVVPISSSRTPSPLRPQVSPAEGVERSSVAVCRGIRSIARSHFLKKVGDINLQTMAAVTVSLGLLLGISDSPDDVTADR